MHDLAIAGVLSALTPALALPQSAGQRPDQSAIARMQEHGPEAESLARRAGTWDVLMTLRPTPDANPIITTGLIAERKMIGLFLEEVMRPAPGSALPGSAPRSRVGSCGPVTSSR